MQLLPPRGLLGDIRLSTPLRLLASGRLAAHRKRNWGWLRRTYLTERWPSHNDVELFNPAAVHITRYRYRGTRIPTPWEQGVTAYRDHTTAMDYLEGLIAR